MHGLSRPFYRGPTIRTTTPPTLRASARRRPATPLVPRSSGAEGGSSSSGSAAGPVGRKALFEPFRRIARALAVPLGLLWSDDEGEAAPPDVDYAELHSAAVRSKIAYMDRAQIMVAISLASRQGQTGDAGSASTEAGTEAVLREMRGVDPRSVRFYDATAKGRGTQAYLWTKDGDVRYLTFRGTSDLEDVLADLDLRMRPFHLTGAMAPGAPSEASCKVHAGFADQLEAVWDDVLRDLETGRGPVVISGHSLGGALATLAACRLARGPAAGRHPCRLLTFGAPRVGDAAFAALLDAPGQSHGWRVFREDDPVPMVPLDSACGTRFCHAPLTPAGSLRFVGLCLDDAGTPGASDATVRRHDRSGLQCIRDIVEDFPHLRVVTDHGIDRYVAWLSRKKQ